MKTRRLVEKLTPIFIKIGRVAFLLGAFLFLTACATDDFTGSEEAARQANGYKAITFGFDVPASTRAEGAGAATALGNHFIVYGEKGETSNAKYSDGNLVFPNYTVHYTASTAYTTTSNTKDWEYVGITPISQTNVKMYDGTTTTNVTADAQTIKYWDYGAATYTFTAVSANKEDIENGRVVIQKNTTGADNVYQKGYTITLAKTGSAPYTYPQVDKLYFADRKVISTSSNADRNQENAYGGNVKFTFRNLVSQIRAGIYETIPGYDISEIKFFITGDNEAQVSSTSAFGAICPNNKIDNYEGTITVTYYSNTEGNENQPKVTQSVAAATDLVLGTNLSTVSFSSLLGTTASNPTWETAGGSFTKVFPQINNTTNLKLKCNYTLWNSVTHETITVEGATAEVPAEYLKWKPNFKYTYIFKISKNTNGQTGTGTTPAGLYPITFDAVSIEAENGQAEYITTVSEPSITTYANASAVLTDNEYKTGANIYVVVDKNGTVQNLTSSNAKLYTAKIEDGAAQEITEQSVANAIVTNNDGYDIGEILSAGTDLTGYYTYNGSAYVVCESGTADGTTTYYKPATYSVKDANGKKLVVNAKDGLVNLTSIPAADSPTGVAISVNCAKFTPTTAGYYVFEFIDTADENKKYYKVIHVVAAP